MVGCRRCARIDPHATHPGAVVTLKGIVRITITIRNDVCSRATQRVFGGLIANSLGSFRATTTRISRS